MDFNFKTDVDNFIKILHSYNLSIGELRVLDCIHDEIYRLMFLKACEYRIEGLSWAETEAKLRENFATEDK